MIGVGLEVGRHWVFASALDWPGWARRGKGEEAALVALDAYRDRYAAVLAAGGLTGPDAGDLSVTARVTGDATTDFGAPGMPLPGEEATVDREEAAVLAERLEACWAAFDVVVAGAPAELRRGPRGGGRDRDAIVDHVREAERTYGRKLGVRVPPRTPWPEQRVRLAAGLHNAGATGGATPWSPRYWVRRTAWHVTDHAWEIEDRSA